MDVALWRPAGRQNRQLWLVVVIAGGARVCRGAWRYAPLPQREVDNLALQRRSRIFSRVAAIQALASAGRSALLSNRHAIGLSWGAAPSAKLQEHLAGHLYRSPVGAGRPASNPHSQPAFLLVVEGAPPLHLPPRSGKPPTHVQGRAGITQSSTPRPATRSNSRVLWVTRVAPSANA